jgi:hypothetical protein
MKEKISTLLMLNSFSANRLYLKGTEKNVGDRRFLKGVAIDYALRGLLFSEHY